MTHTSTTDTCGLSDHGAPQLGDTVVIGRTAMAAQRGLRKLAGTHVVMVLPSGASCGDYRCGNYKIQSVESGAYALVPFDLLVKP